MTHNPIQIRNLSLILPHKSCFEGFSITINYGSRIGIIGSNGSGKSTLLNVLRGVSQVTNGVITADDVSCGYVPQLIDDHDNLSGGERFNYRLTQALSSDPSVLLIDEPTNHLDQNNRQGLIKLLLKFRGTLIVATHDVELLRNCVDMIWDINEGKIRLFTGKYDDYQEAVNPHRSSIEHQLFLLAKQNKDTHQVLMNEQQRAAKSKAKGKKSTAQNKWPTMISQSKARQAEQTAASRTKNIDRKKNDLMSQLSDLRLPEIVTPRFSLNAAKLNGTLVSVSTASLGYNCDKSILRNISLSVSGNSRVAIGGCNGSGKSTFIKAILGDPPVIKTGDWYVPKPSDIGYLDQRYNTLLSHKSVFETIADLMLSKTHAEVRRYLNDFLFRKNEEVNTLVNNLSGREKVRLCLAQIAALSPKLLILDEITNNLDLTTRQHVITVLRSYPGAMIVIPHDDDFLAQININDTYKIKDGTLRYC